MILLLCLTEFHANELVHNELTTQVLATALQVLLNTWSTFHQHERLLQQHTLLVEAAQLSIDHLLLQVLRLVLWNLLLDHSTLSLQGILRNILDTCTKRIRGNDVHGDLVSDLCGHLLVDGLALGWLTLASDNTGNLTQGGAVVVMSVTNS